MNGNLSKTNSAKKGIHNLTKIFDQLNSFLFDKLNFCLILFYIMRTTVQFKILYSINTIIQSSITILTIQIGNLIMH